MTKHTVPDFTDRQLKETQGQLADVVRHAYAVIYVDGMLRSEREGITFLDAIQCELAERGLLTVANGILDFERFRGGKNGTRVHAINTPECAP